jgi:hypothetical protein
LSFSLNSSAESSRSSDAFISLAPLSCPGLLIEKAGDYPLTTLNKAGRKGQFVTGEAQGLPGYFLVNALDLIKDTTALHHSHPTLRGSLAFTHTSLSGFAGIGFIREDPDINLATTLDVTGYCNTSRFDLLVGHPTGAGGLKSISAKGNRVTHMGLSAHAAFLDLAVSYSFGCQHGSLAFVEKTLADLFLFFIF